MKVNLTKTSNIDLIMDIVKISRVESVNIENLAILAFRIGICESCDNQLKRIRVA